MKPNLPPQLTAMTLLTDGVRSQARLWSSISKGVDTAGLVMYAAQDLLRSVCAPLPPDVQLSPEERKLYDAARRMLEVLDEAASSRIVLATKVPGQG